MHFKQSKIVDLKSAAGSCSFRVDVDFELQCIYGWPEQNDTVEGCGPTPLRQEVNLNAWATEQTRRSRWSRTEGRPFSSLAKAGAVFLSSLTGCRYFGT